MDEQLRRYLITAYTEWETLDVETECPDDERAIDNARRYASLKHMARNFPAVIFGHVVCDELAGHRVVGTWEYRLKNVPKPYMKWHAGDWKERPSPTNRSAIRSWGAGF